MIRSVAVMATLAALGACGKSDVPKTDGAMSGPVTATPSTTPPVPAGDASTTTNGPPPANPAGTAAPGDNATPPSGSPGSANTPPGTAPGGTAPNPANSDPDKSGSTTPK